MTPLDPRAWLYQRLDALQQLPLRELQLTSGFRVLCVPAFHPCVMVALEVDQEARLRCAFERDDRRHVAEASTTLDSVAAQRLIDALLALDVARAPDALEVARDGMLMLCEVVAGDLHHDVVVDSGSVRARAMRLVHHLLDAALEAPSLYEAAAALRNARRYLT